MTKIEIPMLYLMLLVEFGLICFVSMYFLFRSKIKLKKRGRDVTVIIKDDLKSSLNDLMPDNNENSKLLKEIIRLEKIIGEKDQKIESMKESYELLKKEYQIIYDQSVKN